jgi:hypothetical protein
MDGKIKMNSKGQVTIFIIIALILIVLIAIFFLVRNPPQMQVYDENNPQAYIEACTKDAVKEAVGILSPQGGDLVPKGSIKYNGIDITYLCYNTVFYKPCINQRPLLVEHLENEITDYITPKVADCFKLLQSNLEKRYDSIETSDMKLTVRLYPKQIAVDIDKKFKMTRGNNIREFDHFKMNMIHPLYDFAEIAMKIVNQETKYCYFDVLGFMILYPSYDVTNSITGDADSIYTIKERATNQQFMFATKSCKLPAGY